MTQEQQRVYRKDYRPPNHLVKKISLSFSIFADKTLVTSIAHCIRNPKGENNGALQLFGADLKLISIKIDDRMLEAKDYKISDEELTIENTPDDFVLKVETEINPKANTALEGLYASGNMLCTQCEAEGFRRMTFYPDRPDVMSVFTTSIEADKKTYPILLSNGNCTKREDLGERHRVVWHDPFPKPCYLFALVAGDLAKIEDHFTTQSGRKVLLQIYCEHGKEKQLNHALQSLKKAMAWDEKRFGREYDLDQFMIVAASFFNSGAMENKGLNIFNAAYVLGDSTTATDRDLLGIESVVAHEYFHNWSGNRVTCRDWFQLSLKEGFTVFRDQEFSCDLHSPVTERIDHVRTLRSHQFPEDAGPMAHAVRPDSYITIDNFYTTTVYEKGAEVVRMLQTLFGMEGFRKGSDLYFERHDGQAVTCDDFAQAIFDANPETAKTIDINQFKLWYAQAGTPRLSASDAYDAQAKRYTLTLQQKIPLTANHGGADEKKPMVIPVDAGLLGKSGAVIAGSEKILVLKESRQDFVFENVPEKPVPSLLRHFSAPVILDYPYSEGDLALLAKNDSDLFNRWDALQKLAQNELRRLIASSQQGKPLDGTPALIEAFSAQLSKAGDDPQFTAMALGLPGEIELGQMLLQSGQKIDIDAIHAAREHVRLTLAMQMKDALLSLYQANKNLDPRAMDGKSLGRRALKNTCLAYLGLLAENTTDQLAYDQYLLAGNMTDSVAALGVLTQRDTPLRAKALGAFYTKWKNDDLILDKWFALQAMADRDNALDEVKALMEHPAFTFTNPNKIYALVGSFCANLPQFHRKDGAGYKFLADVILKLDALNPQVAGRRVNPLARWRDYDTGRAKLMRSELERISRHPGLSKNTAEVALAGLGNS
jgi:aminopeptidase N